MKKLLTFLFVLSCLFASATNVHLGSGSGTISQTTQVSADTIYVQGGTYSSITINQQTNVTIMPYGGNVVVNGTNSWDLSGCNHILITHNGNYIFDFTGIDDDIFYIGTAAVDIHVEYIHAENVTGFGINASSSASGYVYYNGTQGSLILYNASITHSKFTGCDQLFQGDYTAPINLRNFVDSLVVAYDTVVNTATNGLEINGNITRLSVHDNLITYAGINSGNDDVGFAYFNGWGYFYNTIFEGGRGYLVRDFLYSLSSNPGTTLVYNDLKFNTIKYGLADMRCDSTAYGQYCTKGNFRLFNNTILNCVDSAFITPIVVVYQMNAGATGAIYNNFGANLTFVSGGSYITSFDNATLDTSNNVYTQSNALAYLQDTASNGKHMPTATSQLNNGGIAEAQAIPDLYGYTGTGNRIGAVFYNPGSTTPVANAGSPQTVTLPLDSVLLNGGSSTGTITGYAWSQVSGPSTATLRSSSSVTTIATNLVVGTYVFQLTLSPGGSTSTVSITVNPAVVVANAGSNQSITLPTNSVTLNGSASTGTITSYKWYQVSGPNSATLGSPTSVSTTASSLIQGSYVFELVLNGGGASSDSANVTITVNAAIVANAGSNQNITLPTSSTTLSASGSTGNITSYTWVQLSGPSSAAIAPTNTVSTTVSNLIDTGNYVFRVSVNGGVSTASVTVHVSPAPVITPCNCAITAASIVKSVRVTAPLLHLKKKAVLPACISPVVSPGSAQTITLSQGSVTLSGSAIGKNGSGIASYLWSVSPSTGVTIRVSNNPSTLVSFLDTGTFVFTLTAVDSCGQSGSSTVSIRVNPNPATSVVVSPDTVKGGANITGTLTTSFTGLVALHVYSTQGWLMSTFTFTKSTTSPVAFSIPSTQGSAYLGTGKYTLQAVTGSIRVQTTFNIKW